MSVNPVDLKVRQGTAPLNEEWKVVGYDAGPVSLRRYNRRRNFRRATKSLTRASIDRSKQTRSSTWSTSALCNLKTAHIGFAEAAAMPLTSITVMGGVV